LFLGAGSAGTGIAELLVQVMMQEGLSAEQARNRCWLFDRKGLIQSSRTDLADFKKPFAHPHAPIDDFVTAIADLKPTTIIGVSALVKAFNQQVIETMARVNQRPIIFPYSNPTTYSECTAEEAYKWSEGRAVFASGSPFPPVKYGDKTFVPGQGNNVYIFPAMGMAVYATRAKRVTDEMFITAAKALAEQVSSSDLAVGLVYPPQSEIYNASIHIAEKVAKVIFERNLAGIAEPSDLKAFIAAQAYKPDYKSLI
jgi:malate dehydrogenase (oxaloacetate-decarboxylating)(NADP+)